MGRIQRSSPASREEDKASQEGAWDAGERGDALETCVEYPWADRGGVCGRGGPGWLCRAAERDMDADSPAK